MPVEELLASILESGLFDDQLVLDLPRLFDALLKLPVEVMLGKDARNQLTRMF